MITLPPHRLLRWLRPAYFAALTAATLHAAPSSTGTVEGRVSDPVRGTYVPRARVSIDGSAFDTVTDDLGYYRLTDVPAGTVTVTARYTGLQPERASVTIDAGRVQTKNFELAALSRAAEGEVVKLNAFEVSARKEMDAATLAINEQRYSSNIKTVVAADELGNIAEGNIGEFMKFMPGVTVDYVGGDARTISLNGAPPNYTPITVNGFGLASAASSGTSRQIELEQVGINNLSRIEVINSPTPESQGTALAGSVNLVSRRAFERVRPVFNYSAALNFRSNAMTFKKTPGPFDTPERKVFPSFDFSLIRPVNKTFGYTVSGAQSTAFVFQDFMQTVWRGASGGTGGAFPATTPDKPYLTDYTLRRTAKITKRTSFGASMDLKIAQYDDITLDFQWAKFDARFSNRSIGWFLNGVTAGNFDVYNARGNATVGSVRQDTGKDHKYGVTWMPTFTYRHNGPLWKSDLGLGYSHADNKYRDIDEGYFNNIVTRRGTVAIAFENITPLRPGRIVSTDSVTNQEVSPYLLSSMTVGSGSVNPRSSYDEKYTAFGSLQRTFSRGLPRSIKAGFDVRKNVRDIHVSTYNVNFVGADGVYTNTPTTGDDDAAEFRDPSASLIAAPFGFPTIEWPSNSTLFAHWQKNPTQWVVDNENTRYRNQVRDSRRGEETISAGYIRADADFFNKRLRFVGGLRAEQTNLNAFGALSDPTRNFQRDASGAYVLGSNGRPLAIPGTALEISQRTYLERKAKVQREYLTLFPSANLSYNITDALIARVAYYTSIGRPDWGQFTSGISLPDITLAPSSSNRISVNNPNIKAWTAKTYMGTIEYYFGQGGVLSGSFFRREFKNFFASTVFVPSPEFLESYGLDSDVYGLYEASTNYNVGTTRMSGASFNFRQQLTFLPAWGRGFQVFANASFNRVAPGTDVATLGNFAGYIPKTINWGVSYNRERVGLKVNWNYRGRARRLYLTGGSYAPDTFSYSRQRLYIDATAEFRVTKSLQVFAAVKNLNNTPEEFDNMSSVTPEVARLRQHEDFAALWTFGVKGSF